ncbi:hypothetical protein QG37_00328 [Candidozyma auris]|uniref:Uncharacterized protein n=1 Tax=Candidozyma auris TaxID=498019 RepID=A0A0L0P968_CANAR|nr:hypothetical protein QG37_00328 [[Candida] auris]
MVKDTGKEFELPNTAIAVTKSVSAGFKAKNREVNCEQEYEVAVETA